MIKKHICDFPLFFGGLGCLMIVGCATIQKPLAETGVPTISGLQDFRVARDGKALAVIVVKNTNGVAGFAAKELKQYLDRVTGAEFMIVADAKESPRIFVGDCPEAGAAGLDVNKLKRDGFYRAVVNNDLYLFGRDHSGRFSSGLGDYREKATVFAVYDFLEDVCGVRWFMAGPHGEVVPTRKTITVVREVLKEEPAFLARRLNWVGLHAHRYGDADQHETEAPAGSRRAPDRELWLLRMRYLTQLTATACHSVPRLRYGERFGDEHPEWFALRANGIRAVKTPRGEFLCWSHPEVIDAFIADARAYFTGQDPATRGLKSWSGGGFRDEFSVDPNDSYIGCLCDLCQKTVNANPGQSYSEVMYRAVARVADSIKDLEGKHITTLAYGPIEQTA